MMGRDRLKICIVAFFAMGCLFDHLTTSYGLSSFTFVETNPIVTALVEQDIWHVIEILTITAGACYGLHSLYSKKGGAASLSLRVLTFAGLIRFFAGFHNLSAILQVVG
jgi:hypothetical protein